MLSRRPIWLFAAGLVVAAAIGAYAAIILTRDQSNLCEAANDSREVLRNVLLLSQAQGQRRTFPAIIRREDGTEEKVTIIFPELASGSKFYEQALELAKPIDC